MKVFKVTLLIVDFDGLGEVGIISAIEDSKYPNHCIMPQVVSVDEKDIGEWSDDHPLNRLSARDAEIGRLFGG